MLTVGDIVKIRNDAETIMNDSNANPWGSAFLPGMSAHLGQTGTITALSFGGYTVSIDGDINQYIWPGLALEVVTTSRAWLPAGHISMLYGLPRCTPALPPDTSAAPIVKPASAISIRCECGVDSVGGGKHSSYCPKALSISTDHR